MLAIPSTFGGQASRGSSWHRYSAPSVRVEEATVETAWTRRSAPAGRRLSDHQVRSKAAAIVDSHPNHRPRFGASVSRAADAEERQDSGDVPDMMRHCDGELRSPCAQDADGEIAQAGVGITVIVCALEPLCGAAHQDKRSRTGERAGQPSRAPDSDLRVRAHPSSGMRLDQQGPEDDWAAFPLVRGTTGGPGWT
jgi:hypothetical protein